MKLTPSVIGLAWPTSVPLAKGLMFLWSTPSVIVRAPTIIVVEKVAVITEAETVVAMSVKGLAVQANVVLPNAARGNTADATLIAINF